MNDRRAYDPRPLPPAALAVCDALGAPPRLVAHLRLVHDCAAELVEAIHQEFPRLRFDPDAVLFGAATHDIGKALHPQELIGPGAEHEAAGPGLLERLGVPPALARFARTHGRPATALPLEDLLVALADALWKGHRPDELESLVTRQVALQLCVPPWEVFLALDDRLAAIAASGPERLAWQVGSG